MASLPVARITRLVSTAALVIGALAACEHSTAIPPVDNNLETSTIAAEGIDAAALTTLVDHSTAEQSDAVIILRNGKVVYENHFGKADQPIYSASVSKSFISLAYGYLLADGKLSSLDEKVVKYLPGFADNDPRKADITLRMLLNHTSGLKPGQSQPLGLSVEAFALAEPLVFAPGTSWQYLNAGADIAGQLVERIGGERIDKLLQRKLFTPLGITTATWTVGAYNMVLASGAVGGLSIRPMDLAKVGQVILDGGKWHGTQLIPAAYIATAQTQSQTFKPTYGLYWWRLQSLTAFMLTDDLLADWVGNGISADIATKLRPIVGVAYATPNDYRAAVRALLTTDEVAAINSVFGVVANHVDLWRATYDPKVLGMYFNGYNGQYLLVVPDKQLVAVRMRQYTAADQASSVELNANPTFLSDAYNLVPSALAAVAPNREPRAFRF